MKVTLHSPHGRTLPLGETTRVMGILNVTPDSFYDGGRFHHLERAVERALQMVQKGAAIVDVGGESTRPGSDPVPLEEELRRVIPVIEELRKENPEIWISVDTYKHEVAEQALRKGADMVNDISGLTFDPEMQDVVLKFQCPVVIMHILGTPKTMQENPSYTDVVEEVMRFLDARRNVLIQKGLPANQIVIDPGIGFGKRLEDNLELLKNIQRFRAIPAPLLVGHSRKSMIGLILDGLPPQERLEGTLALTAYLFMKGVELVRVHDVKENVRVIKTLEALRLKLYDQPHRATP